VKNAANMYNSYQFLSIDIVNINQADK